MPTPKEDNETYLRIETNDHEDTDFGLSISNNSGMALSVPCFMKAERQDREDLPARAEDYTRRGTDIAESLHFGSAIEYLAAWVNEDRKQAALCRDIHAVAALNILDHIPHWIRYDLFCILESEAMKQVFAKRFITEDKIEDMQPPAPAILREAIRISANNKTDDLVSKMMSELLQKPSEYKGSADRFAKDATERVSIFHSLF